MKSTQLTIVILLIIASFCCIKCSKESNTEEYYPVNKMSFDTISFAPSMKGWELYNWPNGNDWNYSLLVGTNRLKTYDEVIHNKYIVFGKDSLKMLLDKLPENEEIFWACKAWYEKNWKNDGRNLSQPDNNTINEIKDFCTQQNLGFNICK